MRKIKGSEAVMLLLKQYEVAYVFGIPGATEVLFMEALEHTPQIQYILGLNEVVCVGAAEGYARAAGKPAVLNLHTGPGMAAALPLLLNARYGKVPMVILVGQNHTRLLAKDPQLSGDIAGIARPVVKWSTEIYRGEDIPVVLHRVFKMAMQPPMGPVVVSLPYDLLEEDILFDERIAPKTGYPLGQGDEGLLLRAKELILKARRPVMLVQEGVGRSRALDQVVTLAERIGAKVYQIWMGDVNFPVHHPLYCGDIDSTSPQMEKVLHEADLLIEIGGQLFNDAFYSGIHVLPEELPVIQIDDDPWELGKNFPVECGIHGDIQKTVARLNVLLEKEEALIARAKARTETIGKQTGAVYEALLAKAEAEKDHTPVAVTALASAVAKVMDKDVCIVDDSWSSSAILRQIVDFKDENTLFRPRNGGSIGFGLPGGLGVKMALPEKKVLVISGDGSAAWSMQTFWTAAHYKIPVTFVITNNGTYRQVKNVRQRILGGNPAGERHLGMDIDRPVISFVDLAQSMGVKGRQVRDPSLLVEALTEAMDRQEPWVVEVFIESK